MRIKLDLESDALYFRISEDPKNWFSIGVSKRQQSRAAVRLSIEETLDRLPGNYTPELYQHKCDLLYQHIYDSYFG